MPARRKNELPATSALSFEDAIAELEEIVAAMEGEQLPLEELVARYEDGSALLKHCESTLSAAKKRIELITLADHGETGMHEGVAFAGNPRNSAENLSGDPDDNNDITLF